MLEGSTRFQATPEDHSVGTRHQCVMAQSLPSWAQPISGGLFAGPWLLPTPEASLHNFSSWPVYSWSLGKEASGSHTGLIGPQEGSSLLAYPQATGSLQLTTWSPSVLTCMRPSAKSGSKLSVMVSMPSWPHFSSWTSGEDPNLLLWPIF